MLKFSTVSELKILLLIILVCDLKRTFKFWYNHLLVIVNVARNLWTSLQLAYTGYNTHCVEETHYDSV